MPKTRNAFAFRGFDGKRILQRPYFRQFGFADESDEKILSSLTATDSDDVTTLERKNQWLNDIHKRLVSLHALIMRHANGRLTYYRRAVQKKFAPDSLSCQSKIGREQSLMTDYVLGFSMAVMDLMPPVETLWRDSEQRLQDAYRRRFGERLKAAREAAGLSRKELGDAINISPAGYAYYERGQRDVTPTSLIRIARTLKVSSDWLIGLE